MAHEAQRRFFHKVKETFPTYFRNVQVADFGSKDYNGSLRDLFAESRYTGIDIHQGKNVDVVRKASEYDPGVLFETIVSGEMLEHDEHWQESLRNMYNLLQKGGLLAISCAGTDRPEHGTSRTDRELYGTDVDYYRNLTPKDLQQVLKEGMFTDYHFEEDKEAHDTYFYGIKI